MSEKQERPKTEDGGKTGDGRRKTGTGEELFINHSGSFNGNRDYLEGPGTGDGRRREDRRRKTEDRDYYAPCENRDYPAGSGTSSIEPGNHKKRGAPKGNINHLKHGFYAHNFSKKEIKRLEKTGDTLEAELKAAQVIADRIMTRITNAGLEQEGEGEISQRTLETINSLNNVFSNISGLTKTRLIAMAKYEPTEIAILDALNEINLEEGFLNV